MIQLIALLPAALRPGFFLALVFLLVWFVFVYRGLPKLWRRACRVTGLALAVGMGLALYPEYRITTARRGQGKAPGPIAGAVGPISDAIRAAARRLYVYGTPEPTQPADDKEAAGTAKRGDRPKQPWRKPLLISALLIAACTAAYITMEQSSSAVKAKRTLAEVFEYWRDVESWGEVETSRRAAPGDPLAPTLRSVTYHRWHANMALHCADSNPCPGIVTIRTVYGTVVASASVEVPAGGTRVVPFTLAHVPAHVTKHLHVDIASR